MGLPGPPWRCRGHPCPGPPCLLLLDASANPGARGSRSTQLLRPPDLRPPLPVRPHLPCLSAAPVFAVCGGGGSPHLPQVPPPNLSRAPRISARCEPLTPGTRCSRVHPCPWPGPGRAVWGVRAPSALRGHLSTRVQPPAPTAASPRPRSPAPRTVRCPVWGSTDPRGRLDVCLQILRAQPPGSRAQKGGSPGAMLPARPLRRGASPCVGFPNLSS